jgi:hypothetical protein
MKQSEKYAKLQKQTVFFMHAKELCFIAAGFVLQLSQINSIQYHSSLIIKMDRVEFEPTTSAMPAHYNFHTEFRR